MVKTKYNKNPGLVHFDRTTVNDGHPEDAQTKKAFSLVTGLVKMHLISILDVNELV